MRKYRAAVEASGEPAGKQRATFYLPVEVLERAKDAVYWTPGLTLADLVAQALTAELDRLERRRGEPFPRRAGAVRRGRPIRRV